MAADVTGAAGGWGSAQIVASGATNSNQRTAIGFATVENAGFIQPYVNGTGYNNLLLNPAGGNVGIASINPTYTLTVNGTIGTSQVVVTNQPLSDYVFDPAYRLAPLSEVRDFIQANHHLPDIPSDAEARQKGVDVGSLEAKLLAKIEELTLHMIQEHDRNDRLEQENRKLESEIEGLKERIAQ